VIRTLVVADSGEAMASITASLSVLPAVEIVGYASGRTALAAVARVAAPDAVLIDEMWPSGRAIDRIGELRSALPGAVVIGLASELESPWVISALRAGASTVVPRALEPATLGVVLRESVESARHPELGAAA
jgi:two-component system, NarL family, response regulator DesR